MLTEREQSFLIWSIVASIGCVFCGFMWWSKPGPKTVERIVEKPVERIVERPVEKFVDRIVERIVERPVEKFVDRIVDRPVEVIPKAYRDAYDLRQRILSAPRALRDEEALWDLKEVGVTVLLGEEVKKFIGEEELRNRFELILRRNGVPISNDAACPTTCLFSIEGGKDKEDLRFTYSLKVQLEENVWVFRHGEPKYCRAVLWSRNTFGYAGWKVAKQVLMEVAEANAEAFANAYLKANPKH